MAKQAASVDLLDSFEKIPVKIFPDQKDGSAWVAQQLAAFIREKQKNKEKCVLGLATGSTPKSTAMELNTPEPPDDSPTGWISIRLSPASTCALNG